VGKELIQGVPEARCLARKHSLLQLIMESVEPIETRNSLRRISIEFRIIPELADTWSRRNDTIALTNLI
jgi:hypothetical protein